jgi:putative hydrolase of the HAD superfamily
MKDIHEMISEECGFAKPSREIFLRACELAGESPTNAVYVGDHYDLDAQGSRAPGLAGVCSIGGRARLPITCRL